MHKFFVRGIRQQYQVSVGKKPDAPPRCRKDTLVSHMGKTSDSSFLGKFFRSFQPSQEGLLPVITASLPLGKDRMEITGARWNLEGAEAVLQLRSLRASGDFDEYWAFHLRQEYQRNHADHYAGGSRHRRRRIQNQ